MKIFSIYSLSALMVYFLSACSTDKIPGVYRIDIQQGNYVSQEMINKLEPGMSKGQVTYVMGSPLLIDTFHPNRWDYLYSFQPGNGDREQRRITLYFNDDETLDHIEGNTSVLAREDRAEEVQTDNNVVVPLNEKDSSIFGGLLNMIGLGEEETEVLENKAEKAPQNPEQTQTPAQ
jgi:outer membrane protein assembly factor BamE